MLTDALIGTFAPNRDELLNANKCFLYHVIGNGTGDWDVPVGGMGAVTGELYRAARAAGAVFQTGATVTAISPDGVVTLADGSAIEADTVLANVAPFVLDGLVADQRIAKPEGAQVKVNLLLSRLPRLKDPSVDPIAAFGERFTSTSRGHNCRRRSMPHRQATSPTLFRSRSTVTR